MATLDTVIIPLASIFKLDLMVIMLRGGGEGRELRPPGLPGDSFGLRRLAGTAPLSGLI